MFKKLKDKIAEQSPLKLTASMQQFAQAVVNSTNSSIPEPVALPQQLPVNPFSIGDEDTPQNSPAKMQSELQTVDLNDTSFSAGISYASPLPNIQYPGIRSRRSSIGSATSEASSIFGILDTPTSPHYHLQSDWESAASEEGSGALLEAVSKEQLLGAYRGIQSRYHKYKGRYTDLARHYRALERDLTKTKNVLATSQDKALRRISELKEQCHLEQSAKAHLEEALRNDLEEKDLTISTLNTKIVLMKSGQTPCEDMKLANNNHNVDEQVNESQEEILALKSRIASLESMQTKLRDALIQYKDNANSLNEAKAKVEQERDAAKSELATLMEQAASLRRQEQEASLSLAENKQQIHKELKARETEVRRLHASLDTIAAERDQLQNRTQELTNKSNSFEVSELRIKISNLEQQLEEQKRHREAAEIQLHQLREQASVIHQQVQQTSNTRVLQEDISHIQDLQDLQTQLQESKSQLQEKENELKTITLQLSELYTKVNENSHNANVVNQLTVEICELKKEITISSKTLQHHQQKEKSIQQEKKALQMEIKQLSEEKEKLKYDYKERIDAVTKKNESMENNFLNINKKLEAAYNDIENANKMLHECKLNYSTEIDKLNSKCAIMEEEINTLVTAKQYVENKMEELCKELQESRRKLLDLAGEKAEIESKYEDIIKQLQQNETADKLSEQALVVQKLENEKQTLERLTDNLTKELDSLKIARGEEQKAMQIENVHLDDVLSRYGDKSCNYLELTILDKWQTLNKHIQDITNHNSALLEKNNNLFQNLADNKKELSVLEEQLQINNREKENLHKELDKFKASEEEIQSKFQELQLQSEKSVTKLIAIQSEKQDFEVTTENLKQELQKSNDRISKMQIKFKEIVSANKNLEAMNNSSLQEKETMQNEFSKLSKTLEEVSNFNVVLSAELESAKHNIEEKEKQLKIVQEEIEKSVSNQNKIIHLEKDLTESKIQVQKMENEVKDVRSNLEKAERLNEDLSTKSSETVGLISQLELVIQNLQHKENNYVQEIDNYKSLNESLELKIENLLQNINTLNETKAIRTTELEGYKENNREIAASMNSLRHELLEKENQYQLIASQTQEFEENLQKANIKIAELLQELDLVKKSNRGMEVKIEQTENEKVALKSDFEITKQRYESQLTEMYIQLEDSRKQMKLYRTELEQNKIQYTDMRTEYKECKIKYENQLEEVNKQLNELKHINKNSSNNAHELQMKLDSTCQTLEDCKHTYELQLEDLYKQMESIKTEHDTVVVELSEMKRMQETAQKQWESKAVAELEEKIKQIEESANTSLLLGVKESEIEINRLKKLVIELESKIELLHQLETEIPVLSEKIVILEQQHSMKLQNERSKYDAQLEKLRSELEKAEDDHNMQIKLVVKDYENKLAEKEEEYTNELNKHSDQEEIMEAQAIRELREQIREMRQESKETELNYETQIIELRALLKEKEANCVEVKQELQEQAEHWQQRIAEIEKQARSHFQSELVEVEARHKEHMEGMIKEWQFERKSSSIIDANKPQELELSTQLALKAMESSAASAELLQQQLMAQSREVALASPSTQMEPALEIAYLRNVLYEYMMGKQPLILAKVIAAVAKFDPDQTHNVLQREEHKQSLLGQIGFV